MLENGVLKETGPKISENDRLTFTVFLALAFHAMLFLGIAFAAPDPNASLSSPVMQVVLAQYHSQKKPDQADFVGQDNQEGGGQKDVVQTPTTTELAQIPDPTRQASVSSVEPSGAKSTQPQPEFLTADQSKNTIFLAEQRDAQQTNENTLLDTATLLQKSYELAGLNARLDDKHQAASKENLRKRQASAAIHRSSDAMYLNSWMRRIEEVGNKNYPAAARQKKIYGDLLLKVAVNRDGTIREVNIMESSGHKILDDAAIAIVRRAAPFAPFDEELKKDTDVLEIVRLWQFQPGDIISTR
ncbi:energy transducer TonB [Pleionea sp. CnH1-48]|uniref:energy transducer TonB n=1 Tax=Pleionea sp. CnH1-48 TaxID=2954494 RepID=UPI0020973779|nr:TonB family protein [Pleionea sp. CnH1-48]MCO7225258.1 TonB family protein [Pleionea sp. CnH1-48]